MDWLWIKSPKQNIKFTKVDKCNPLVTKVNIYLFPAESKKFTHHLNSNKKALLYWVTIGCNPLVLGNPQLNS